VDFLKCWKQRSIARKNNAEDGPGSLFRTRIIQWKGSKIQTGERSKRFLKKVAANWWTGWSGRESTIDRKKESTGTKAESPGSEREHSDGKTEMIWSKVKIVEALKKETSAEWKVDLKKEKRTSIARTKGAGLNKEKLICGKTTVFYTYKCCELTNGVCLRKLKPSKEKEVNWPECSGIWSQVKMKQAFWERYFRKK
jgi:hypothetical protein